MVSRIATFILGPLFCLSAASGAMAGQFQGQPRINTVNQRLVIQQQHRIGEGALHGQLGGWQAARDTRFDARVGRQVTHDEAMHGGHITFAEQHRPNRELDRNSINIFGEHH
jgi:hypothetical protein